MYCRLPTHAFFPIASSVHQKFTHNLMYVKPGQGQGLAMAGVRAEACMPRGVTHAGPGRDVPCPEPKPRKIIVGATAPLGFMVYQNSNVLDLVNGDYINPDTAIARVRALGAEVSIPIVIGVVFELALVVRPPTQRHYAANSCLC